jgi:hypothetical protein
MIRVLRLLIGSTWSVLQQNMLRHHLGRNFIDISEAVWLLSYSYDSDVYINKAFTADNLIPSTFVCVLYFGYIRDVQVVAQWHPRRNPFESWLQVQVSSAAIFLTHNSVWLVRKGPLGSLLLSVSEWYEFPLNIIGDGEAENTSRQISHVSSLRRMHTSCEGPAIGTSASIGRSPF